MTVTHHSGNHSVNQDSLWSGWLFPSQRGSPCYLFSCPPSSHQPSSHGHPAPRKYNPRKSRPGLQASHKQSEAESKHRVSPRMQHWGLSPRDPGRAPDVHSSGWEHLSAGQHPRLWGCVLRALSGSGPPVQKAAWWSLVNDAHPEI